MDCFFVPVMEAGAFLYVLYLCVVGREGGAGLSGLHL